MRLLSYRCKRCGRLQRFAEDEWPDECCEEDELEEEDDDDDDAAGCCDERD